MYIEYRGFDSHPRQLIFLGKVTALGVLCCCLFDLACFFLPSFSHLSLTSYTHIEKHCTCTYLHVHQMYMHTCIFLHVCTCACTSNVHAYMYIPTRMYMYMYIKCIYLLLWRILVDSRCPITVGGSHATGVVPAITTCCSTVRSVRTRLVVILPVSTHSIGPAPSHLRLLLAHLLHVHTVCAVVVARLAVVLSVLLIRLLPAVCCLCICRSGCSDVVTLRGGGGRRLGTGIVGSVVLVGHSSCRWWCRRGSSGGRRVRTAGRCS